MKTIISYILNMLPYMLIAVPVYLPIRYIIIKRRKAGVNWLRETALFIFIIFLVGLASQTIIPKFEIGTAGNITVNKTRIHQTNLIPFKVFTETYREVFVLQNIKYFIVNFLGNLAVFMPIGFFVPLLWNKSNKGVIAIGFCSSFFIEFCQLFLRRGTDVDDLILNTVGTVLGLLLYRLAEKVLPSFILKFKQQSQLNNLN